VFFLPVMTDTSIKIPKYVTRISKIERGDMLIFFKLGLQKY